jgi:GNAT superfamily N-acetyltransferase
LRHCCLYRAARQDTRERRVGRAPEEARRDARLVVGYVFADKNSGEIVVLALLPEWEARGIGKRLLDMIVTDLAKLGFRRLFLGCSADPRVRSYGFYRHLGWKSTGAFDANDDEVLELFIGGCGESAD